MTYFFPSSNGACCYENGQVTTAIVDSFGSKRVDSRATKNKIIFWDFVLLRGLQYFIFGLIAQYHAFTLSDELQVESAKKEGFFNKISQRLHITTGILQLITCIVLGLIFGVVFLYWLPNFLTSKMVDQFSAWRGLVSALIKTSLVIAIFGIYRFLPIMQSFYKFNGACSQAKGEKTSQISKNSPYFALNFLNFLFFALILSTFVVSLVQISINFWLNALVNIGITILCISISYELCFLVSKSKQRWLKDCVLVTCPFVCIRPGLTQEEILRALLIEKDNKGSEKVTEGKIAMSAVLAEMQTKLIAADKYEKSDVEWIIATILDKNRAEVKLLHEVSKKQYRDIMRATERRAKGEPLSSIFGYVDFYGVRIEVNKKVLSPRMETEILVDEVLKLAKNAKNPRICDLCTGSGAIIIAIAKNTQGKFYGIDISKAALLTAEQNAKNNSVKVDFIESDLFGKNKKKFDIIVSNPPYIPSKDIEKLDVEVKKYDPSLALDGGADGLDFYRRIINDAPAHLEKNGQILFEVGKGQAGAVRKMLKEGGFIDTKVIKDYNGIERIVYGKLSK